MYNTFAIKYFIKKNYIKILIKLYNKIYIFLLKSWGCDILENNLYSLKLYCNQYDLSLEDKFNNFYIYYLKFLIKLNLKYDWLIAYNKNSRNFEIRAEQSQMI